MVLPSRRCLRCDRSFTPRTAMAAPAELRGHEMATGQDSRGSVSVDEPEGGVRVTCFSEEVHDVALHFQIVRLERQVYVWIGCNTAKLGHLYAAATTRPSNFVSVTSLLGGGSDNVGSSIARRLVLKTGLNIVLACNIPKDIPTIEASAERKLVEKLKSLGYVRC